jgi:hypothetical protein
VSSKRGELEISYFYAGFGGKIIYIWHFCSIAMLDYRRVFVEVL